MSSGIDGVQSSKKIDWVVSGDKIRDYLYPASSKVQFERFQVCMINTARAHSEKRGEERSENVWTLKPLKWVWSSQELVTFWQRFISPLKLRLAATCPSLDSSYMPSQEDEYLLWCYREAWISWMTWGRHYPSVRKEIDTFDRGVKVIRKRLGKKLYSYKGERRMPLDPQEHVKDWHLGGLPYESKYGRGTEKKAYKVDLHPHVAQNKKVQTQWLKADRLAEEKERKELKRQLADEQIMTIMDNIYKYGHE